LNHAVPKEILKPEFQAMCQKHNVLKLFAFGSAITDRFDAQNSDIDLLVEIDEKDPIERGKIDVALGYVREFFS
jgi:predicted nucleotidyltransferase